MDPSQKDKLISFKNKLHQMHLEAEEKKKMQAEKEHIQAEDRARRAESRAPPLSQLLPGGTLVDEVNNADNDGDPIDPTGTTGGSGIANGEEGDDESSEGEENGNFKLALKKKIQLRQDNSLVPSLGKNIRIKVPSSRDKEPQQGVSIMDELNHAVEFGTLEEAKAALEKVNACVQRATHWDPPRAHTAIAVGAQAMPPPITASPVTTRPSAIVARAPAQAPAGESSVSGSKRKSSKNSEDPSSSSGSSGDEKPEKKPKKKSKSKKKKMSKKPSDPDDGDSTPSESSSSDDSSAIKTQGAEGSGTNGGFVKRNSYYKKNGGTGAQKSQGADTADKNDPHLLTIGNSFVSDSLIGAVRANS
ncbi:uncharacterized protein MELLADRAFT_69922 [Melampsora larici-populina 98AG31]|uniref:Uncharacterized protein n=1 Tax=Melampsora larici-populina (strain 98AG31 / pathotype 3-4-7) TaxID=747676 RepID=F4SCT8_MELLP|nr:uncharacterized protein MELLADRAFT_69922 [Melampsora larici-populina 98AG31]EGF97540.1 hypothetical protein MELLADRAFT_69922 [Melampsora larici-populina 98AG31]